MPHPPFPSLIPAPLSFMPPPPPPPPHGILTEAEEAERRNLRLKSEKGGAEADTQESGVGKKEEEIRAHLKKCFRPLFFFRRRISLRKSSPSPPSLPPPRMRCCIHILGRTDTHRAEECSRICFVRSLEGGTEAVEKEFWTLQKKV